MNDQAVERFPLILNFDQSVDLSPATHLDFTQWQEAIRFGTTLKTFAQLRQTLQNLMPEHYGPVFMGSGDYHHITLLLLEHFLQQRAAHHQHSPIDLIIFDNHPDNMRFPFGIHCGSWVYHAAKLPQIRHIHVLGITSNDIGIAHAIENHLRPLYRGKLTYWSMQVNTKWAHYIGLKRAFRSFDSADLLIETFLTTIQEDQNDLYLSIDKDAFSKTVIQTNWDQGIFDKSHLWQVIDTLKPRMKAYDITGEVSEYRYQTAWKRLLSKLDQQAPIPQGILTTWQQQQNAFNSEIVARLT